MRAISLWQPWASLWLTERKIHETRTWFASYRGPLAVHAAKRALTAAEIRMFPPRLLDIVQSEFGFAWPGALPYGSLIGVVELERCRHTEDVYDASWFDGKAERAPDDYWCGDFSAGRFAWQRGGYQLLKTPLPFKGQQGFFSVHLEQAA